MARRGLLVDWGGVLTTNLFTAFSTFSANEGLAPETVRDAFRGEGRAILAAFELGQIDAPTFETRLADVLEVSPEGLVGRLFGGLGPDQAMLDGVAAIRGAGIRTGLLSNSWGADLYDPAVLERLFDVLVISGVEGVRKPQQEIYDIAAGRMGLAPEELVFIDDIPGNLKPARAMGMATVRHTDATTSLAELEALFGLRLSRST